MGRTEVFIDGDNLRGSLHGLGIRPRWQAILRRIYRVTGADRGLFFITGQPGARRWDLHCAGTGFRPVLYESSLSLPLGSRGYPDSLVEKAIRLRLKEDEAWQEAQLDPEKLLDRVVLVSSDDGFADVVAECRAARKMVTVMYDRHSAAEWPRTEPDDWFELSSWVRRPCYQRRPLPASMRPIVGLEVPA